MYIQTRKDLEKQEESLLAPYAVKNSQSRGRAYLEQKDPFRLDFQRDRDRIIHAKSFRRLKGKTQVFVSHYGDHYRSRLSHTLEMSQISRDVSRNLALNEDLAECIALAHDLGHTPFGHAGEEALNDVMQRFGKKFEHNAQSRRIVEKLEKNYSDFDGLNLTFEVRDGLIKHRSAYDKGNNADLTQNASLEAQVVNLSDEIAYQNHDLDDGLRSGIFKSEDLDKLELWQEAKSYVDSNLPEDLWINRTISRLINLMVLNLYEGTLNKMAQYNPTSLEDVVSAPEQFVCFTSDFEQKNNFLRQFLYLNFYKTKTVMEQSNKGKETLKKLFFAYHKTPDLLPDEFLQRLKIESLEDVIKDYIAGMTDSFALNLAQKIN